MTPAEVRAFNAGVETVRAFAQGCLDAHQDHIRRKPDRRYTVTLGFLGAYGRVVDRCDQARLPEPQPADATIGGGEC